MKIKMKYLKYGLAIISGIAIVISTFLTNLPPPPDRLPIIVIPSPQPIPFPLPIPPFP